MTARPLAPVFAMLLASLPATSSLAQAPPLEESAGRVLAAPGPLAVGTETLGSLELVGSTEGADLRSAPGTAELHLSDGGIAGTAVRVNEVRNVDPATGRPRGAGETGPCTSGAEPACLAPGGAVDQNLQAVADLCAFSEGFTALDFRACALDVYNSDINVLSARPAINPVTEPTVAAFLANLLAGNSTAGSIATVLAGPVIPLVPLNVDPCDGFLADCATVAQATFDDPDTPHVFFNVSGAPTLNLMLSHQTKALLGCGELYDHNCEIEGIRLERAEAGALLGSFVYGDADPFADVPQPGTIGALALRPDGATRPDGSGGSVILPGARGANEGLDGGDDDPGYDPTLDGCSGPTTGSAPGCNDGESAAPPGGSVSDPRVGDAAVLQHPFAGAGPDRQIGTADDVPAQYQLFASELAALSWNFLMTLTALSLPDADGILEPDEFDLDDPFRTNGCSFARPGLCYSVVGVELLATTERDDDPSGAPRLRWVWETGAEYAIDEATGALAPFLGGRLHAAGPEVARLEGEPTGVGLYAALPDGAAVPDSDFVVRAAGPDQVLGTADDGVLGLGYGVAAACGNGEDDDGDGLYDIEDPGCPAALAEPEDPNCDDGEDNDGNGLTDFDDPKCTPDFPYGERPACGLGAELALLLLPWLWRVRRRSRGGSPGQGRRACLPPGVLFGSRLGHDSRERPSSPYG